MTFTVVEASVGALFIQLASTNYYWQIGSTIGFSSAIYNTVFKKAFKNLPLLVGVVISSFVVRAWLPGFLPDFPTSNLIDNFGIDEFTLFSVAGFLVGFGTRLGAGCTSGHMIGGLSRLRARSLAAVVTFSGTAIVLNKFLNLALHSLIEPNYTPIFNWGFFQDNKLVTGLLISSFVQVYVLLPYLSKNIDGLQKSLFVSYVKLLSGLLFGIGLHVSGMVNVSKTIGFLSILDLNKFDPSLLMIMLFTVGPNIIIWRFIKKPLLAEKFDVAHSTAIPPKFLLGNVIFGLGWGLLGVCPGPGLVNTFHYRSVGIWLVSFLTGHSVGNII